MNRSPAVAHYLFAGSLCVAAYAAPAAAARPDDAQPLLNDATRIQVYGPDAFPLLLEVLRVVDAAQVVPNATFGPYLRALADTEILDVPFRAPSLEVRALRVGVVSNELTESALEKKWGPALSVSGRTPGSLQAAFRAYEALLCGTLSRQVSDALNAVKTRLAEHFNAKTTVLPSPDTPCELAPGASVSGERPGRIVLRLEGGDIVSDATRAISQLYDAGLVRRKKALFERNDGIDQVFRRELGLPVSLHSLAQRFNGPDVRTRTFHPGDGLWVPDLRFSTYSFRVTLDWRNKADVDRAKLIGLYWRHIVISQKRLGTWQRVLTLRGYRAEVGVVDPCGEQKAALAKCTGTGSHSVLWLTPTCPDSPRDATDGGAASLRSDAAELVDDARWISKDEDASGQVPKGREANLALRVGRSLQPLRLPNEGAVVVRVVDTIVDGHSDLIGALINQQGDDILPQSGRGPALASVVDLERAHGTHLAGLVSAQWNDFGIVGVAPNCKVMPEPWDPDDVGKLDALISHIGDPGVPQSRNVWLLARNWRIRARRAALDPLVMRISQSRMLWVVAAGPGGRDAPRDIATEDGSAGIASIATLPNVIVVAGCDNCQSEASRPAPTTNWHSHNGVTLLAPWQDLWSTVTENGYARLSGTSQSAALVAGLAARLKATYREILTEEGNVKTWLFVTGTPVTSTCDPGQPCDVPIVDGDIAMRSPTRNHLRMRGEAELRELDGRVTVRLTGSHLEEVGEGPRGHTFRAASVRRLLRREDGWFVWECGEPHMGNPRLYGPLRLDESGEALQVGDRRYRLDEVSDVIFRWLRE